MSSFFLSLVLSALGIAAFKPSGEEIPLLPTYDQRFEDRYSPLKYLGPYGPFSSRSGNGISTDVPAGCEVDQVVLLQRHGERYPSASSYEEQRAAVDKIYASLPEGEVFHDDLAFLNRWQFFLDDENYTGLMVETGPYSGMADLYGKGAAFRSRYGHLWDGQSTVPLFASDSERVIQSSHAFGRGFFGYNYTDVAKINVISESKKVGANAISPGYCHNVDSTECELPNPEKSSGLDSVIYPEFDKAAVRLNEQHNLSLTGSDIFALLEVTAFDIMVRGYSPWLNVFTREELLAYHYRMGIKFYCYSGHGSQSARAFGTNWANATNTLLNQGPEAGLPLALNFGHDSDIVAFLGGLNILKPLKPLDPNRVTFDSRWEISDIVPMGAQLVIERLKCAAPGLSNHTDLVDANATLPESVLNNTIGNATANSTYGYFDPNTTASGFNRSNGTNPGGPVEKSTFVRLLLNDAVLPLDDCYEGPGYICAFDDWNAIVAKQTAANKYVDTCQPQHNGYPEHLSYYWDWEEADYADNTKQE